MARKYIAFTGILVFIGLLCYAFLFGKLFPYSPVILGFEKHELPQSIVYSQDKSPMDDYGRINDLITSVEGFHELDYLRKPRIFLFSDSISYIRHTPSKARFCAFYNGRVFASPWALEEAQAGRISLEIYLRHELSHALLHQHSGLLRAHKYPKWLAEGIAMFSADQMGTSIYPGKDETYRLIQSGNFIHPDYFGTKKEHTIILDPEYRIPFMYSEFAFIVDYLIRYAGKDKFLDLMSRLTRESDFHGIFKDVYGLDFDTFLNEFMAHAEAHKTF